MGAIKECNREGLMLNSCCLLLLSRFSCVRPCATPWTAAYQASPSMGFSRQEHWSGLPFPSCCLCDFNPHFATFGASLVALMVKNLPAMWETWVQSLGQGRSPGERHSNALQYSCLENSMDRGAWEMTIQACNELDMTERLTLCHLVIIGIHNCLPWGDNLSPPTCEGQ